MARSAEKAMTALARWRAAYVVKTQEDRRRPYKAIDCQDCKEAMLFRRQVVHELTKKISQIQNPSLGEYKIRDMNDEINKLIKEKMHWEERIKELGGPDYVADAPKLLEKDGKEAPGYRGYRYFGAARDLPGVRELFEEEPQLAPRKTRGELMRNVGISYYGNCDEDDGVILPQEEAYEKEVIKRKIEQWKQRKKDEASIEHRLKRKAEDEDIDDLHQDDQNIYEPTGNNPIDDELHKLYNELASAENQEEPDGKRARLLATLEEDLVCNSKSINSATAKSVNKLPSSLQHALVSHVQVYSQEEIEQALVEQRKKELLSKYVSSELLATVNETGNMLGHRDERPDKYDEEHDSALHHPLYDESADEDEGDDEEGGISD